MSKEVCALEIVVFLAKLALHSTMRKRITMVGVEEHIKSFSLVATVLFETFLNLPVCAMKHFKYVRIFTNSECRISHVFSCMAD